jgi:hypothetical protein
MAKLNPDASAAISAARAGRCRDAMKHLYDASPHVQGRGCDSMTSAEANAYRQANLVVAGLCTVQTKPKHYKSTGFDGARRRRRRTRRR